MTVNCSGFQFQLLTFTIPFGSRLTHFFFFNFKLCINFFFWQLCELVLSTVALETAQTFVCVEFACGSRVSRGHAWLIENLHLFVGFNASVKCLFVNTCPVIGWQFIQSWPKSAVLDTNLLVSPMRTSMKGKYWIQCPLCLMCKKKKTHYWRSLQHSQ